MYFPCEDFLWWDVLFCPEALQSCLMSCADAAVLVSIKSFHKQLGLLLDRACAVGSSLFRDFGLCCAGAQGFG